MWLMLLSEEKSPASSSNKIRALLRKGCITGNGNQLLPKTMGWIEELIFCKHDWIDAWQSRLEVHLAQQGAVARVGNERIERECI